MRTARLIAACAVAASCAIAAAAHADDPTASALPAKLRDVGIDQKIGAQLPLDLSFRDENGKTVRLGDYFGKKPAVVMPVYYNCPMLCPLALDGLARSLKVLTFGAQSDYELIVFSIDPRDTPENARKKKVDALRTFGRSGGEAGWHFLTADPPTIAAMTRALGFRYTFDQARGQFVHASTLVLTTPQGKVARYLYTSEPAPKDLRLALVEASTGKLGTLADQVLLYCFHYDVSTGKYTLLTMRLLRLAAIATVLLLGGFIAYMLRQERRGRLAAEGVR